MKKKWKNTIKKMTEKPLEQILDEHMQSLQEPEELKEIYTILTNYRNRSLSRNEHEQLQELYSALKPKDLANYSGNLEEKFAERAKLDLKYTENIKGHPTPQITTGRYENAIFALNSYASLGDKLNLPSKLMKKIKRLHLVYNKAEFSSDEKYAYLDFSNYLAKKSRALKRKGYSLIKTVSVTVNGGVSATSAAAGNLSSSVKELYDNNTLGTVGKATGAITLSAGVVAGAAYIGYQIIANHSDYLIAAGIAAPMGSLSFGLGAKNFPEFSDKRAQRGAYIIGFAMASGFAIAANGILNHEYFKTDFPREMVAGIGTGLAFAIGVTAGIIIDKKKSLS